MKEFEKWWNKVSMEGDWDYENYALMGWRAALEMVLDEIRLSPLSEQLIKEELEGA